MLSHQEYVSWMITDQCCLTHLCIVYVGSQVTPDVTQPVGVQALDDHLTILGRHSRVHSPVLLSGLGCGVFQVGGVGGSQGQGQEKGGEQEQGLGP